MLHQLTQKKKYMSIAISLITVDVIFTCFQSIFKITPDTVSSRQLTYCRETHKTSSSNPSHFKIEILAICFIHGTLGNEGLAKTLISARVYNENTAPHCKGLNFSNINKLARPYFLYPNLARLEGILKQSAIIWIIRSPILM